MFDLIEMRDTLRAQWRGNTIGFCVAHAIERTADHTHPSTTRGPRRAATSGCGVAAERRGCLFGTLHQTAGGER